MIEGDKLTFPIHMRRDDVFTFLLTSLFFMLSLAGIMHHEVWLDEAHSFLIARDTVSFPELIRNIRNEGHPFIWYFILWLLNKISHDIFYMQLLHISVSTLNVFLMLRFAPFGQLKKTLFAFGYYFFYEYNIISRNYVLCLLCVTVFCILISRARRNYIAVALVLAVMANIHFIGLLLSVSLGLVTLILMNQDKRNASYGQVAFCSFLALAFMISFLQVWNAQIPVPVKAESPGYFSSNRLAAFTAVLKSLFPFPQLGERIWNTSLFTQNKVIGAFLALLTITVVLKSFMNKPLSLLITGLSALLICAFFYSLRMDNYTVRHWGFIFLGFYAATWIGESVNQQSFWHSFMKYRGIPQMARGTDQLRENLIYSVLFVQALTAAWFFISDISHPFSNAKNVADYIHAKNYGDDLIIINNSTTGPPVAAYLKKKVYYPECCRFGSYSLWNSYPVVITREKLIRELASFRQAGYKRAILVMYKNADEAISLRGGAFEKDGLVIKFLASFEGGMVKHENYDLFLISYN